MENQVFTSQERGEIKEVTPAQVHRAKVIIDVREEGAFSRGHISGAINVNQDLLESRMAEVVQDLSMPILIYCSIGKEAPSWAEKLVNLGYRDVSLLKGGLQSWLEAGGTVELQDRTAKASEQRAWWLPLVHGFLGGGNPIYKKARKPG